MCSLDVMPIDRREEVIRELSLESSFAGPDEGRLTVFVPRERKKKKVDEGELTLKDPILGYQLWQQMTPVQRVVAQGVVIGKGWNEIADELSDSAMKVHPDDVGLAHQCVCDMVRAAIARY